MRVCIVGVNQGLGLVLSRLMAEKGHIVYAGFRNQPSPGIREAVEEFAGFRMLEIDVTKEAMAEGAAKKILEDGGKLDAVVVTAGILTDSDRERLITDAHIDDLRAALEVNVVGSEIMIKHFSPLVNDGGMFIMITSEAGSMTNIGLKYPGYSVSKAAQNKLIAIFAKTVTRYQIYAIHPGRMNTVMGRNDAQIEPEESARSIFRIITGEQKVSPERGWFINYRGEAMEI
ncbi:MAG: SDR family NAD(P)-dependent oxidoreductase [Spirochaetaceae bacterium]|jgi:NAD(P)-dependent dehydrogenase (short-subunit alcohol dehydrogenase family)|nr:SDR family NAD(P)-dependent oxidoreductase [Spirochaetaceae bacterium]